MIKYIVDGYLDGKYSQSWTVLADSPEIALKQIMEDAFDNGQAVICGINGDRLVESDKNLISPNKRVWEIDTFVYDISKSGCAELVDRTEYDSRGNNIKRISEKIADKVVDNWSEDGDYDLRIVLESKSLWGDNGEMGTEYRQRQMAEVMQDSMDPQWSESDEFTTFHLGFDGECIFTWTTNGGTKGAHDRTRGDGRWVETYHEPTQVQWADALVFWERHFGWQHEGSTEFIHYLIDVVGVSDADLKDRIPKEWHEELDIREYTEEMDEV